MISSRGMRGKTCLRDLQELVSGSKVTHPGAIVNGEYPPLFYDASIVAIIPFYQQKYSHFLASLNLFSYYDLEACSANWVPTIRKFLDYFEYKGIPNSLQHIQDAG